MAEGKIIITGSEGLIGRCLTAYFRQQQACTVVAVDLALGNDLNDEKQVIALFQQHADAQFLVNLFALNDHVREATKSPDLFEMSLDSFRHYCETNLVALFSVCRQFAQRCQKPASIVNMSSLYGIRSPKHVLYHQAPKNIAYTTTKHGVIGLTRHLATYLAPDIRVNCLVPGGVEADQGESFKAAYSAHVPMRRMLRAHELAGIVDLLCSDAAGYITGAIIPVDGGWTAW